MINIYGALTIKPRKYGTLAAMDGRSCVSKRRELWIVIFGIRALD